MHRCYLWTTPRSRRCRQSQGADAALPQRTWRPLHAALLPGPPQRERARRRRRGRQKPSPPGRGHFPRRTAGTSAPGSAPPPRKPLRRATWRGHTQRGVDAPRCGVQNRIGEVEFHLCAARAARAAASNDRATPRRRCRGVCVQSAREAARTAGLPLVPPPVSGGPLATPIMMQSGFTAEPRATRRVDCVAPVRRRSPGCSTPARCVRARCRGPQRCRSAAVVRTQPARHAPSAARRTNLVAAAVRQHGGAKTALHAPGGLPRLQRRRSQRTR